MKSVKLIIFIICLGLAQVSIAASDKPLGKVPFSDEKLPDHFGENCNALTTSMNPLLGYHAAICKAYKGVVMIKPTPAADKKVDKNPFYALALSSAGWAVNSDYYGPGAYFVVGSAKWPEGCRMVRGDVAAYRQARIKKGKDMGMELAQLIAESKMVECPDFLR